MTNPLNVLNARAVEKRYAEAVTKPSDIQGHMARFVDVVQRRNITKVIELGVRNGMSTIAWLHALNATGGHLWSVDKTPYGMSTAVPIVIRHKESVDNWTFVQGLTTDPGVIEQMPDGVGLVFIDSMHDYDTTLAELIAYEDKLSDDGLFLLHDTEWPYEPPPTGEPPEVVEAVRDFLVGRLRADYMSFPDSYGLGVIALDGNLPW